MSVHVISWVLTNSEAKLGDRLVLIALADHASADGTDSYASVKTLAREARLSERAVQYALKSLKQDGYIVKAGEGPHGTTNYTVLMGGADFAGVQNPSSEGAGSAPEPSLEPTTLSVEGSQESLLTAKDLVPARSENGATVPEEVVAWSETERVMALRVDRKPVALKHAALAVLVLGHWNIIAKQDLTSDDWLRMIVMRIREYPDMTSDDHYWLIHKVLNDSDPWWKVLAPNIVYGNGAQFERCLTLARNGHKPKPEKLRYGRGITPAQAIERTRGMT